MAGQGIVFVLDIHSAAHAEMPKHFAPLSAMLEIEDQVFGASSKVFDFPPAHPPGKNFWCKGTNNARAPDDC
jgi:hypothetical protein